MKGLIFTIVFAIMIVCFGNTRDIQSLSDPSFGPVSKDVSLLSDWYEAELMRHERDADKKGKLQISEQTVNKQNQKTKPKQRSKQRVTRRNRKRKNKTTKKNKGKKKKGKKKKKKKKGNNNKKTKKGKKNKNRQNNVIVEKKPHEGPYGYMHPEEIDVSILLNFGTFSKLICGYKHSGLKQNIGALSVKTL